MNRTALTLILLACFSAAQFAGAAIRIVTNTADSGPGSLRDTIAAAAAGDTIHFSGMIIGTPRIVLTSGELAITTPITIDTAGRRVLVDGNHASRVFAISANATLSGLTITNGFVIGMPMAGVYGSGDVYGGGIFIGNLFILTLIDCSIQNCMALGGDGTADIKPGEAFGGGFIVRVI